MKSDLTDHHDAAGACPNCGAAVSGNFCHQCGQEAVLHPPSTREFLHEFIGHYVALEGKLWKSLGLLLFRPGRLTLEYIKGRRVRYVQPLRLYLTFSLIFFAVMKFTLNIGGHDTASTEEAAPTVVAAHTGDAKTAKDKFKEAIKGRARIEERDKERDKEVGLAHEDKPGEIRDGTQWVRDALKPYSPRLAEAVGSRIDHFAGLSGEERSKVLTAAFFGYVPYAIFFMMPVFAMYLKLLYLGSGRRFGEHLLFALHANAFAFLTLSLMKLVPERFGLVGFLLGVWLVFYLPTAMRKVYGGSRKLTALRWLVLMILHMATIGLAIFIAVAFGVLH